MQGLELEIKGNKFLGVKDDKNNVILTFNISKGEEMHLSFLELPCNDEGSKKEMTVLYENQLEVGDEFVVRVKKIN